MSSEPSAVIPASHQALLDSTAVAIVSTVGPRGEPQTSPVWFGWDGKVLRFSHTKGRQKYRNLVRDPRIAVCIIDPANPYRYIEIRGAAAIEDDPTKAFIDVMSKKYTGNDKYQGNQPGDERIIVTVMPAHVNTMG
ncbi:MAG: PPOX class F420-dependent oxidoreductase [Chloroflexota bacterium]